jgi:hypothetical protein
LTIVLLPVSDIGLLLQPLQNLSGLTNMCYSQYQYIRLDADRFNDINDISNSLTALLIDRDGGMIL